MDIAVSLTRIGNEPVIVHNVSDIEYLRGETGMDLTLVLRSQVHGKEIKLPIADVWEFETLYAEVQNAESFIQPRK